ncbi:MAG: tyrosine-type recombinase/integrase [Dermatophilaceae bacterium]
MWSEYASSGMTHLRATTQSGYRHAWKHVAPTFGRWPVAKIEHADVAEWVAGLSRTSGTDTVRKAHGVLCRVLDHACLTRRVPVNVARSVRLPKRAPARERILTIREVHALADAMTTDKDVVLALAYLGLRWSELAALRCEDVNLERRRVHVVQRATEVDGRMDLDQPKSRAGHRHVPVPARIAPYLQARIDGQRPDALVFPSPDGDYLRVRNWRRRAGFDEALKRCGFRATPHDLRRTFGSLARMAGADLRFIQKAMGHESITTTARIYAHLYDDELDAIAQALDGLHVPPADSGEH